MEYKDYKFTSAEESMNLTYEQACKYYEETLFLINDSKYDLFNDKEELSLENAREKYNEVNRRLQTFGQAFELFMKYIIHASRIEKNPNITVDQLWNKWIRGHQMIPLINEKANSPEVLPNFKEIFNLSMNSYYGIFRMIFVSHLGFETIDSGVEPSQIFRVLMPVNYSGFGALSDERIEEIIDINTSIYEKCRYNIQQMTNYNFEEVFNFISFVKLLAKMVKISNDKTKIDYNVAYVHAICDDPFINGILTTFRSKEEIEKILKDEYFNKNAKLLSFLLTINKYSINDIKKIIDLDERFSDPENLYTFLTYDIPIENIIKCNELGIDVMLLASDFSIEQIFRLVNIPIIGKYLNNNPSLVNKMVTQRKSDVGLIFDDWYRILSSEEIVTHPECINLLVNNYMRNYHFIEKNNFCNSIFSEKKDEINNQSIKLRDGRSFSSRYTETLLSNIKDNTLLIAELGLNFENFPTTIDSKNVRKIFNLITSNGIKKIPPTILAYPYNEVFSIINSMKNKNYIFASESFPNDFWKEYDEHALYDMVFKDNFITDEFLEKSGLIRISDTKYCVCRTGQFTNYNYNNPLPNLKH